MRGCLARRGISEAFVEHHRDVRAETGLDVGRALRREQMERPIQMRTELGALLVDLAAFSEAEYLIAAAVGEDRMRPADEPVEAAAPSDQFIARPEVEVIGVAEDDLRAGFFQIALPHRLDASLRADRHEGWRPHRAMRGAEFTEARRTVG